MITSTKALKAALAECSPATKTRTTLPILSCVRMEAFGGFMSLKATNQDTWIERQLDCDTDLDVVAVNMRLLQQILEFTKTENVELTTDGKRLRVKGSGESILPIVDPNEFPAWPGESSVPLAVNCADLADGLSAVHWAAADPSAGQPALENVCVQLRPTFIQCLAYSGAAMFAKFTRAAISAESTFQVPVQFVDPLISALRGKESTIALSPSYAHVTCGRDRTLVKLSALQFMQGWERLFTKLDGAMFARVPSAPLSQACACAMAFNSINRTAQLNIDWRDDGTLAFECVGDVGEDRRSIQLEDAIGSGYAQLTAHFLHRALDNIDAPAVTFTPTQGASFWSDGDLVVAIAQLGNTPPDKLNK